MRRNVAIVAALASLGTTAVVAQGRAEWVTVRPAPPPEGRRERARDDYGSEHGVELGLRLGYSLPLGNVWSSTTTTPFGSISSISPLGDWVSAGVPIWLDVGFRFNRHWYAGLSLIDTVGFIPASSPIGNCRGNFSCSANIFAVGVDVAYHFDRAGGWEPWLGLGFGYEKLNLRADDSATATSTSLSLSGWQYLTLQGGIDWKPAPFLGIGPFAALSLGEYDTASDASTSASIGDPALHAWLSFGLRGTVDIFLR